MHNTFPSTSVQRLTSEELTEKFLPKHYHPQDLLTSLEEKEPSVSMGSFDNRLDVRLITGTEQVVESSSRRIRTMLKNLYTHQQIGPRARVIEQLYRESGCDKLTEEIALYRIDGGAASIIRSVAMLRECGIELAHSWTVMCLRTQTYIRDLVEVRQQLGVPEILLAGHLMHQKSNGETQGKPSELIYTRDTLSLPTKLDKTHPVVDGRGFAPSTILWVGKKIDASAPVPLQSSRRKHRSEEASFSGAKV